MSVLNSIKIGNKIRLGFATVMVMMVATIAVGIVSLNKEDGHFDEYQQLAKLSNQVGDVQAEMLNTRLAARDFIVHGQPEFVDPVRQGAQATLAVIGEALELAIDEGRTTALVALQDQLEEYVEAFDRAVVFQEERNQHFGVLSSIGPEIDRTLTEIMTGTFRDGDADSTYKAGIMLRHALLARFYVALYFITNQPSAYERTIAELDEMAVASEALLASLSDFGRRQLAQEALTHMNTYSTTTEAAFEAISARNEIIADTLDRVGPTVATAVAELKAGIQARQTELGVAAEQSMQVAIIVMSVVGALAIAIGIAASYVIAGGIAGPVTQMTGAMRALAEGDRTTDIPARDRHDEIGEMAKAVQVFKDNMRRNDELSAKAAEEEAQRARRAERIEELAHGFDAQSAVMLETVAGAATELASTANGMTTTAEEASSQATTVAAAAEEATGNVQTVAAAAEELGTSVSEISRQVHHQAEIAGAAAKAAHTSDTKVQDLDQAAREIGAVVQLITSIAEQTNLLALNATIEAARAGDAGKGFAVVASEVKTLAGQTAKATEEISQKIMAIQGATEETVTAIQTIGSHIAQMQEISSAVAAAVEQQTVATGEISQNVQQAAAGTREVSVNIAGVSEASQSTGQAASDVLHASEELSRKAEELKGNVQRFLGDIRAA